MALEIWCYDPRRATEPYKTIIPRELRSQFKYSSAIPGGCRTASWHMDCAQIERVVWPVGRSRVVVADTERGTFPWRGILQTPQLTQERGRLVSADFQAIGCAQASIRQFEDVTILGVADTSATSTRRQIIANLGEMMQYGLTIAGDIVNGTESHIASGTVFVPGSGFPDTKNFQGQSAAQLWEETCNLTRGFDTPFIWQVRPDESGVAALFFYATPGTPFYFEDGRSKETTLEFDYGELANWVFVQFQGAPLIKRPTDAGDIDYTLTPDVQTHYVDVSEAAQDLGSAEGFADALLDHFNYLGNFAFVTGGKIVLDRDIRAEGTFPGTPEPGRVFVPITEVHAGWPISYQVVKNPYTGNVGNGIVLIQQAEYDEEACTTTLSPAPWDKNARDVRAIALRGEGSKFTWAWMSRALTSPTPDLQRITRVEGTSYFDGFWDTKEGNGWGHPSIPSVAGQGNGIDRPGGPGTPPTAVNPNPIPYPRSSTPDVDLDPPAIDLGIVPIAMSRESIFGIGGLLGAKIIPQALPDERINIPATFGTPDENGDLTDGERMHTDIQEGFIDTLTVSVLNGTLTTVKVTADVYNWDTNSVRLAAAFTITLSNQARKRFQWDNSDGSHRPILLYHGDQLIWKVEAPDGSHPMTEAILNCCLSGWKNWKEFPVMIGPDWLPGNGG